MADSPAAPLNVAALSLTQRLAEVLTRTLPKLAPAVRAQLAALIEPKSLAIMAGVVAVWAGSHGLPVGIGITPPVNTVPAR